MALDRCQRVMIDHLKKDIVKEDILEARCLLDHGKHNCTNPADSCVGNLYTLPVETQQRIVSFLDIKSLLILRRVSKSAMSLVNSDLHYHKVVTNAPMALRMAIAIGMHDKYTIADLFAALCQRTCTECGTLAHYICLFTCQRVCLSQNGFCRGDMGPWKLVHRNGETNPLDAADDERPQSFTPVPGLYKFARPAGNPTRAKLRRVSPGDIYIHWHGAGRESWDKLWNDTRRGIIGAELTLNKSLSVVVAAWLSKTSLVGVYGTQCLICKTEDETRDRKSATGTIRWIGHLNLRQCEIWTEEDLVKHMRDVHGLAQGDCDN